MISLSEAIAIVRAEAPGLVPVSRPVAEAAGAVLASDVHARIDMPAFDNSAMDGYAVRAAALAGATAAAPVSLYVAGQIAAGAAPGARLEADDRCLQIMTGAPMPAGADAVVPVERVTRRGDRVELAAAVQAGANLRLRGEDFAAQQLLVPAGTPLGPFQIQALVSAGVATVPVWPTLRLGLVSTGDEVVGDVTQPLRPGQIYNSSSVMASAFVPAGLGLEFRGYGVIGDRPEDLNAVLERMLADGCSICVSTGAVSAGVFDFVAKTLGGRGARLLFHQIRLRPGKPNLFARLAEGPVYFGLPGNPVSTAAGLRFLVYEYVRAATGRGPEVPVMLPLLDPVPASPRDLTHFLKARVVAVAQPADGVPGLGVEILAGQGSHMVRPMLDQTAWAVVPEGVDRMAAGAAIAVWPLMPGGAIL